jgi:hypothetical protein
MAICEPCEIEPPTAWATTGELEAHVARGLRPLDPGAGKTIMAGLFIKELVIPDEVRRDGASAFSCSWARAEVRNGRSPPLHRPATECDEEGPPSVASSGLSSKTSQKEAHYMCCTLV